MKFGIFLVILMLAVGSGFLINDSIHLRTELALAHQTVAALQKERSQLGQQVAQQEEEFQMLETQYRTLERQNKILSHRNSEFESQIKTLSTDLNTLRTENEVLQKISTQLASASNSSLDKFALMLASLLGIPSGKTMLVASVPPIFLVGSGILTYSLYFYRRKKSHLRTYMISVSKRELDDIICHRRTNKVVKSQDSSH